MEPWISIVERIGIPSAFLIAVLWYVLIPLTKRQVKFIDSLDERQKSIGDSIQAIPAEMTRALDKQTASICDKLDCVKAATEASCKAAVQWGTR